VEGTPVPFPGRQNDDVAGVHFSWYLVAISYLQTNVGNVGEVPWSSFQVAVTQTTSEGPLLTLTLILELSINVERN